MPLTRPTLADLIARIRADLAARLPSTDPLLRRSMLEVISMVEAGVVHGLHGRIDDLARQLFPDTADTIQLSRWAAIWGVPRKAAALAVGPVDFTGTDGTIIPASTIVQRPDGIAYTTDAQATIAAGVATANVTAELGGLSGDALTGVGLSLATPIAGIVSAAVVGTGGLTGGADAEGDTALRTRLLARIQAPPHGGSAADYDAWALAVPGVTRVWTTPGELGLGTVTVRFAMDDVAHVDGIPLAADVTAVQAAIDLVRPVTAAVTVVAPVAVPLAMTVGLSPNTATVQAAVQAEVDDAIRRDAVPGGTILLSRLREAISIATGENDHNLVLPVADVAHTTGQIAVPTAITFQAL